MKVLRFFGLQRDSDPKRTPSPNAIKQEQPSNTNDVVIQNRHPGSRSASQLASSKEPNGEPKLESKEETMSALLDQYIRQAYPFPKANNSVPIFQPSPFSNPPTLIKGQVNRILTYRGMFNPPHQGHKQVLCHAFYRSKDHFNLVAAIVVPVCDKGLENKIRRKKEANPIILSQDQRRALWKDPSLVGGWHWVYPGHSEDQWSFESRLWDATSRDGYMIEYVRLCGPDNVGGIVRPWWRPKHLVICGASERAHFIDKSTAGFSNIVGCSGWTEIPMDRSYLDPLRAFTHDGSQEYAYAKLKMLYPQEPDRGPIEQGK
ncbi:hypothetical protein K469DRAFT_752002 [Zopfia rhizophila CBS 207.26]|uniref:Cytidyltransferase-like domain-containing protein n=1 Tax=Zopfia rhizophila CBS 207.26 TaxID=1314779 RepID=A0A6A6DV28_9PEZI|nr:hypothetical protein K469DRAFT_752002 [Zopfia rhizophila CBS 207.26]